MPFGLLSHFRAGGSNQLGDAPSLKSATNVASTGGTTVVRGANLQNGCTVFVGQGVGAVATTFVDSTEVTCVIPAEAAGAYDVTVTNPDTQSAFVPGLLTVSLTQDPQTILGANLGAWYRADTGITTGSFGFVTRWNDKGHNGADLFLPTGSTSPQFTGSSANFNGQPTVNLYSGSNSLSSSISVALGSNQCLLYPVMKVNSRTVGTVFRAGQCEVNVTSGGDLRMFGGSTPNQSQLAQSTQVVLTPQAFYAFNSGSGANSELIGIAQANMGLVTSGGTGPQLSDPGATGPVIFGARLDVTVNAMIAEVPELVWANVRPTDAQLLALYQYFNFRYNLDPTLSFTRALDVMALSGSESRIAGTGFNATTAVTMPGHTAPSGTYLNAGAFSLSGLDQLQTGSYDIVITNGNSGASLSVAKAITYANQAKPDTIFGRNLVAWGRSDNLSVAGNVVTAFNDQACIGNVVQQQTALNQPVLSSSNPNLNNRPSVAFINTASFMQCSAVQWDKGLGNGCYCLFVESFAPTSPVFLILDSYGDQLRIGQTGGTGNPSTRGLGGAPNSVTWSPAENEFGKKVQSYHYSKQLTSVSTSVGLNINFRTEVTNSAAGAILTSGQALVLAEQNGGANDYIGNIAEFFMVDCIPNAAQFASCSLYLTGVYG